MNNIRKIIVAALLAAVVYISTSIGTALPFSGYIHLGDSAVFLSGLILGPSYGLISAALGSALADGFSGFFIYIPSTIILKGLMAYITGLARNKKRKILIRQMIVSGLIMTAGYYITEVIIYGSAIAPLVNLPFNILQFSVGIIISLSLSKTLNKFRI